MIRPQAEQKVLEGGGEPTFPPESSRGDFSEAAAITDGPPYALTKSQDPGGGGGCAQSLTRGNGLLRQEPSVTQALVSS